MRPSGRHVEFSAPSPRSLIPQFLNLSEAGLRRSGRDRKPSTRAKEADTGAKEGAALRKVYGLFSLMCFATVALTTDAVRGTAFAVQKTKAFFVQTLDRLECANTLFDETLNEMHLFCFTATKNDNDTYSFREMLNQPDKVSFLEAMMKEVDAHETREHWTRMLRKDLPEGAKTILSIWSFKRKTLPDGQILKYKARLCAHGGMQQWGVDYWETYAPVVNWADLDVPVYMEIPVGMEFEGLNRREMVLSLNKSLYGLCQSSSNWFKMLSKGLDDRGFVPSQMEQYLGVDIKRNSDGSFELRQPYLIQRILDLCKVDDSFNGKTTPAAKGLLSKDSEGASRKYEWNYRSAVGFVIMYAGCPVLWVSKLQTEIALSTTEAEYIALSQAMREVIPFMNLLKELSVIFDIYLPEPEVHCKVFEDNNSCIAVAESTKFSPRTKHIAIKYHHFRSFVSGPQKCLKILPIDTREQTADIFTKPLDQ
eukprot:scaffold37545_cov64-Attheya_sp.AAC.1